MTKLSLRDRYERIAPFYDLLDAPFEQKRYRALRPLLFEGLHGAILDAGVGTGRNIAYYPDGVRVTGVDQSPAMLARARQRALEARRDVDLRLMDVTRLDFPDDSFDAAVASFLFCVLPADSQVAALRELRRVVRPGGTLRLLEYVRPTGALRNFIARLWAPWMAWAYGAGFDRQTEAHLRELGLEVVESRYVVDDLVKMIVVRL
ncbi:MAG: methyltransferase, UbiE/COQ5 family protein [Hyphomicrobiales bacterium]|nr:methyltransferase, UbiE/COQ5 family protein [Hyphomicrobiales bacterium]